MMELYNEQLCDRILRKLNVWTIISDINEKEQVEKSWILETFVQCKIGSWMEE